jgi:hypothetical protein
MNSQIESWRVQQYGANVYHLAQQEGSVIAPLVRKEKFVGKAEFFDTLGKATAQDKVGRNTDTPNLNIDHSRRMVTTVTREWGTLVDRKDKLQNIHAPESEYAKAAAMGLGRKRDQVLIEAAFGTAKYGEDGSSSQVLTNAQKVTAVASAALAYPNIQMLRKAKRTMDHAQVKGVRHIVHSADFLEALLSETSITSGDYNTVKALVQGEINSFMGFMFHLCEEIDAYVASTFDGATYKFNTSTGLYDSGGTALGGTEKVALAFVSDGIIEGETEGSFIAKIDPRPDKSYSQQVYTAMDVGGVRMEEAKVVQLIYKA